MRKDRRTKSHLECDWLLEKEGFFFCCDSRSLMFGKKIKKDEAIEPACGFFHQCTGTNKGFFDAKD